MDTADKKSEEKFIVKEDFHRSNRKRVLHTFYLFFPVVLAFAGYFISEPIWMLIKKTAAPELYKFICSAVLFLISSLIVFIATRNTVPLMKISLTNVPEQDD